MMDYDISWLVCEQSSFVIDAGNSLSSFSTVSDYQKSEFNIHRNDEYSRNAEIDSTAAYRPKPRPSSGSKSKAKRAPKKVTPAEATKKILNKKHATTKVYFGSKETKRFKKCKKAPPISQSFDLPDRLV